MPNSKELLEADRPFFPVLIRLLKGAGILAGMSITLSALGVGQASRSFLPPASDLQAAEDNDVNAQMRVATAFMEGTYGRRDQAAALRWFQRAYANGSIDAEATLGQLYLYGQGVQRDDVEGAKLINDAAGKGNSIAVRLQGSMYENGVGVKQNLSQAVTNYRRAADAGDVPSLLLLGRMYLRGAGVPRSQARAFRLYSRAAQLGDQWGQLELGQMYETSAHKRSISVDTLDSGVQSKNETLALESYLDSAKQGNRIAMFRLGKVYSKGYGVAVDPVTATNYFMRSAMRSYAPAQVALGEAYAAGTGVEVDPARAYALYSLASKQGFDLGTEHLASLEKTISNEDRSAGIAYLAQQQK